MVGRIKALLSRGKQTKARFDTFAREQRRKESARLSRNIAIEKERVAIRQQRAKLQQLRGSNRPKRSSNLDNMLFG